MTASRRSQLMENTWWFRSFDMHHKSIIIMLLLFFLSETFSCSFCSLHHHIHTIFVWHYSFLHHEGSRKSSTCSNWFERRGNITNKIKSVTKLEDDHMVQWSHCLGNKLYKLISSGTGATIQPEGFFFHPGVGRSSLRRSMSNKRGP